MIQDLTLVRWYERIAAPRGRITGAWITAIALAIGAVAWMVYATGGTTYVWAHTIYVPILLAAMLFHVRGALLAALASGLALGPWMPLDVAAGIPQETINWIYRTGFLSVVAVFAGLLFAALDRQLIRLRRLAFEDIETHLPNRLSLEYDAQEMLHRARRDGNKRRAFLLSIQVSNFQDIVMTLGPAAGRELLGDIADELEEIVVGTGQAYRLGTDSFALVLPDSNRRRCYEIAERAIQRIETPHFVDGIPINLDAHIGLAAVPYHERDDATMLIRKSVQAMQTAVGAGRRWSSYDSKQDVDSVATLALLGELKPALERNELELHFQPKVNLADGRVSGCEALIRWRHPERGMIPPGLFIPQAERTGLIHALTRWVLEAAVTQAAEWNGNGMKVPIAVNISGRNLADDEFTGWTETLFEEFRPPAGSIELELTENSLLVDTVIAGKQLERLKQLGITLAIDDFGTGYSSLGYLQRLPVDTLKIDRSFVSELHGGETGSSSEIVRASIELAHNLKMTTIAEGVETVDTVVALERLDCDAIQGYLCAKPMPAADFAGWLAANAGVWRAH